MKRMFINDAGGKYRVSLKNDAGKSVYLIWGDPVAIEREDGDKVRIKTGRSKDSLWGPRSVLSDKGLLELYIIDVGQGDSVLMRTPDDEWHLIDAGVTNTEQMTTKGAANFIRWKFQDDLGIETVSLRNAIVTHPDEDHYGGMMDLLSGSLNDGRTFPVKIGCLWHNGMGRFADSDPLGHRVIGSVGDIPSDQYGVNKDGQFITELLDGKASFSSPSRPFEKKFAVYATLVGSVPGSVGRLSHLTRFLPGYASGENPVTITILGPILERLAGGSYGLRVLGPDSITRNGHSVVLRVDYGKIRILLTGDLNSASQRLLLSYHPSQEFTADAAKGCHHGSEDIDLRFIRAIAARTTIVSSGDNEDYAHPRPVILGASARYGREAKGLKGEVLPPLLYSTELARSVMLKKAAAVRKKGDSESSMAAKSAEIKSTERGARFLPLDKTPISTDLVYGLINLRTDGERILCGYMKESGNDFDIQVFRGGVEA